MNLLKILQKKEVRVVAISILVAAFLVLFSFLYQASRTYNIGPNTAVKVVYKFAGKVVETYNVSNVTKIVNADDMWVIYRSTGKSNERFHIAKGRTVLLYSNTKIVLEILY